eukprot:1043818-Pyramimonas_sp.AAC.1
MSGHPKRLKLSDLGRKSHATDAGLACVLKGLRDSEAECPSATSTWAVRKAKQHVACQGAQFGPL